MNRSANAGDDPSDATAISQLPAQLSRVLTGEALTSGYARGPKALLSEPLSFWGGYDSVQGTIVDKTHPCFGQRLGGTIMVMPRAKGSSSSSSVLAEAIRNGTGPLGIILRERDLIIATGVIVASELYAINIPLVVVADADFKSISDADAIIEISCPNQLGAARVTLIASASTLCEEDAT